MNCLMNRIVRKYRVILLIHHPVSYENNKSGVISLKLKERMIFSKAHGLITVSKTMRKVIQKMLNMSHLDLKAQMKLFKHMMQADVILTQLINLV